MSRISQLARAYGDDARKYPDFCYRIPIAAPIPTPCVDPVVFGSSYYIAHPTAVDVVDFAMQIDRKFPHEVMDKLEVWLLHGKYTRAKAARLVYSADVYLGHLHHEQYFEEAQRTVFRHPHAAMAKVKP